MNYFVPFYLSFYQGKRNNPEFLIKSDVLNDLNQNQLIRPINPSYFKTTVVLQQLFIYCHYIP